MATVAAEPGAPPTNGKGHVSDLGPPMETGEQQRSRSKAWLRGQQMMDRVQPAMNWSRGVMQGPIQGLRTEFGRIVLILAALLVISSNLIWLLERSEADNAMFSTNYLVGIGDAIW